MRPRSLGVLLAVALLAVASVPAAAHGAYLTVDDQVSADGGVVIRNMFVLVDRYVVLYDDAGGSPGEPIGHRAVEAGPHSAVPVTIDGDYWSSREGNVTVWAMLHSDDGDDEFDPADDPALQSDRHDGVPFTVRKGSAGNVHVVPAEAGGTRTSEPMVTVNDVSLARNGYVVLHASENGTPGDVVGWTALPAGVHEDVEVSIDDAFFEGQTDRFFLVAVVYEDDGDGEFDGGDSPVQVGDSAVQSQFYVRIDDPGAGEASLVNTPEPQTTTASGPGSSVPAPGFGIGVAVVALALAAALAAGRRRIG